MDDWSKDVDFRLQFAIDFGKKCGFIKSGDSVVCITGWRQGAGSSNTVRIECVISVIRPTVEWSSRRKLC